METVFRCLLIRPPSEVSRRKPIPLKSGSPFQMQLEQLRNSNQVDILPKIHNRVSSFIRSEDNLIDGRYRLYFGVQLGQFIAEVKKSKKPLNIIEELISTTTQIFGQSPASIISSQEFKRSVQIIKDSIIAIKINNDPIYSANLLQLTDFLYGVSCIDDIGNNNQEYLKIVGNYRLLFERQLVLPEEIFPLVKRRDSQETTTDTDTTLSARTDPRTELNERLKKVKQLEFSLNELRSFDPSDLEYESGDGKTLFALKREALDKFSDDAVKIIKKEMKLMPNELSIDKLIRIINKKVISEYKEISDLQSKSDSSKTIIRSIGTSLLGVERKDASSSFMPETSFDVATTAAPPAAATATTCVPKTQGSIRPIGVADLLTIRQQLREYRVQEVAHIENILKGEIKSKEHRRATTTEESFLTERGRTTEDERESESTTRFETQREVNETLKEDSKLEAGLAVQGKYGPVVKYQAHVNGSISKSREKASKFAAEYSNSVTNRASSKITEKFKEVRFQRILREVEEKNTHKLDNTPGSDHISGVYQWVEKVYEARVFNYGLRTMYEFFIPEPALFFIEALKQNNTVNGEIKKPEKPGFGPGDITEGNYENLIKTYGLSGVSPPPQEFITLVQTFNSEPPGDERLGTFFRESTAIKIPDGYKAVWAAVMSFQYRPTNPPENHWEVRVSIGRHYNWTDPNRLWPEGAVGWNTAVDSEIGDIPVSIGARIVQYAITIEVWCTRTDRLYKQWQSEVFNALLEKYQQQLDEYEEKIAALKAQIGVEIRGRNPDINIRLIKDELKKACISLISRQNFDLCDGYDNRSNGSSVATDLSLLGLNFDNTEQLGTYVRFFEDAFEWENMNFIFSPYFWSQKDQKASRWIEKLGYEDVDPMFESFLKAGGARVIVPVRATSEQRNPSGAFDPILGFEAAIDHFMNTGEIWNGGGMPIIISPLYVSIIDEIRERSNAADDEVPQGTSWEVIVPTTLVKLRKDDSLPKWKETSPGKWDPIN